MGTLGEIILALVFIALFAGTIYAVLRDCKRNFKEAEIGDQYLIMSRRNPRKQVVITITDIDTNKGTISYNLKKNKSDTDCYGEKTEDYKYFFLSTILSNNATYVEYLGNNT